MSTLHKAIRHGCAASLLASFHCVLAQGQAILVNWDHSWQYMRPLNGSLPPGSGGTEPNAGPVKWYARQEEFLAGYAGPSFCQEYSFWWPFQCSLTPEVLAGYGPGPLADNTMSHALGDPDALAPPEFTGAGTWLIEPESGNRLTAYFRTIFTVPDDGAAYINPAIRYLVDDGGWVYLDGVPILRINMRPGAEDTFPALAANVVGTEDSLRTATIFAPVGTLTGGGLPFSSTDLNAPFAGNAILLRSMSSLAPGEHTLAVSVHNGTNTSADIALALQLQATRFTDADGDGMSDTWELAGGLAANDPADRNADPDDDGQTNYQEALAGTDPRNPASCLRIVEFARDTSFWQTGYFTLTWLSVPGKYYQVEYSLDGSTWTSDGWEIPAAGAPAALTAVKALGPRATLEPGRRLFRVKVSR